MHRVTSRECGSALTVGARSAKVGPCWFTPPLKEDLRRFIQDVHHVFVVENLADVVAEGTNAYYVVLESWYDVSASYR